MEKSIRQLECGEIHPIFFKIIFHTKETLRYRCSFLPHSLSREQKRPLLQGATFIEVVAMSCLNNVAAAHSSVNWKNQHIVPGDVDLSSLRLAQEPWRWRKAVLGAKFTAGVKVALIAYLEFVNRKEGCAFASYRAVAEICGLTERAVRAAVAAAKSVGFLKVIKRRFNGPNIVALALPQGAAETVTSMPDSQDEPASSCPSNRHSHDGASGTHMPDNLRLQPSTGTSLNPIESSSTIYPKINIREDNQNDSFLDPKIIELNPRSQIPIPTDDALARATDGGADPLLDYVVQKVTHDRGQVAVIGRAACHWLGLGAEHRLSDGRYPDRALTDAMPRNVLAALKRLCYRGELKASDVIYTVMSIGIFKDNSMNILQQLV
jgi:hypothetical protein